MTDTKTNPGNFFEDFRLGQVIRHATPRTVTAGDQALYTALYGTRFAVQSSDTFARAIGYGHAPVDDLLVFHIVFGKTVPDISLNAVANLGYADGHFLKPVYPGDTLSATSEVIGLKENSNGKTGTVYVRSTGLNQEGDAVLSYVRWVMVRKRDEKSPASKATVPDLPEAVLPADLGAGCPKVAGKVWDDALSGSVHRFRDYKKGERIDHVDGMTVEEAEHMLATRLYQNTAKVHFDQLSEAKGRFGRRLIYGGHVISLARALSFNGLGNAFHVAAINGGRHVAPLFAQGTVYAWSEIVETADVPAQSDLGALRILTRATRDLPAKDFPTKEATAQEPGVILEFDYWVLLPR
ncbi:MaoC family dehydratase [Taklimakanibacter deserti]|uniref:MaoC family dehydratase n=1 Tax=Taklimakanibacter deserti TaxID=2267839 RepID=UPI000E6461FB